MSDKIKVYYVQKNESVIREDTGIRWQDEAYEAALERDSHQLDGVSKTRRVRDRANARRRNRAARKVKARLEYDFKQEPFVARVQMNMKGDEAWRS
jgi:hypothetical protein